MEAALAVLGVVSALLVTVAAVLTPPAIFVWWITKPRTARSRTPHRPQDLLRSHPGESLDVEIARRRAAGETDLRTWELGRRGEREVGLVLDGMRRHGFVVMHSVPLGTSGTDVDHLVISDAGAFAINTKNRRGRRVSTSGGDLTIDGESTSYVAASAVEAKRVSRILGVPVTPVLCVLADPFDAKTATRDTGEQVAIVCGADGLSKFLSRHKAATHKGQVRDVVTWARRRWVWERQERRVAGAKAQLARPMTELIPTPRKTRRGTALAR